MNYSEIKKLDEETLLKLTEGKGPSDECLCYLFNPPEETRSLKDSIKKAFRRSSRPNGEKMDFASIKKAFGFGGRKRGIDGKEGETLDGIPYSKEVVKRTSPCGKCGCDSNDFVLKHSYANIRITTPDITSVCPCPTSDCMPDKDKFMNNIKVTVEQMAEDANHSSNPFLAQNDDIQEHDYGPDIP